MELFLLPQGNGRNSRANIIVLVKKIKGNRNINRLGELEKASHGRLYLNKFLEGELEHVRWERPLQKKEQTCNTAWSMGGRGVLGEFPIVQLGCSVGRVTAGVHSVWKRRGEARWWRVSRAFLRSSECNREWWEVWPEGHRLDHTCNLEKLF